MEESNSTQTRQEGVQVSSEALYYIDLWIVIVVTIVLSCFGMVTNGINQKVFYAMGLSERVNFTLFALSFFDLLLCFVTFASSIDFILIFREVKLKVDQFPVLTIILLVRAVVVDYSALLLAFISFERCVCVTFPFVFNTRFNTNTTRIVMVLIMVYLLFNFLPLFCSIEFVEIYNTNSNETYITFMVTDFFLLCVQLHLYIICSGVAYFCQICIFVSAILMYRGLRKSSQVRSTMQELKKEGLDKSKSIMSKKEKKVVRMVMILACLYLPTAVPQVAIAIALLVIPDFMFGPLAQLYNTCHGFLALSPLVNASFTIVIYYNYNSYFRTTLLKLKKKNHEFVKTLSELK